MFDRKLKPFAQFDQGLFDFTLGYIDDRTHEAIGIIEARHRPGMYVGHSGGKDSVLVRWMADRLVLDIPTLHTPKVEGPNKVHLLTMKFIYEEAANRPIMFVPLGNDPRKWGYDTQVDGTRRAEAERSDGRSTIVVIDGQEIDRANMPHYTANGLFGLSFVYPFVDWSDIEVWAAIYKYQIRYSEEYFHV